MTDNDNNNNESYNTPIKLPTEYQSYVHLSRYSKWLPDKGRRETWEETVDRYIKFFSDKGMLSQGDREDQEDASALRAAILNLEVMPSMRCMMTAGEALDRDNVAGFNCSYTAIDGNRTMHKVYIDALEEEVEVGISSPTDFDEIVYILMCGTGTGFSVERQYINSLPVVGEALSRKIYSRNNKNYPGVPKEELSTYDKRTKIIDVQDSKYGWASAYRILITELYNGNFDVQWDVTKLRPAGSPLKTFGGRSSGPKPLVDLFNFTKEVFKNANGRKLRSIEVHDIVCKIADIVVVGGVRRSALISLSNSTDERMRVAKSGEWWRSNGQRALANNSIAYTEKPDIGMFIKEWKALYDSKSGERGIFNRQAAQKLIPVRRKLDGYKDYGCNPLTLAA